MGYFCEVCGGRLGSQQRNYCSNACKMKAYRKRKDPLTGSYERQKERIHNGVMTKLDTTIKATCEQCGMEYYRTGTQALQMYCSDACKQKAYRARKKESSALFSVGDNVLTDTGREATIKEMRGTTAAIVIEKIGNAMIPRYHTLKRLSRVSPVSAPSVVAATIDPAPVPGEVPELYRCGGGPQGIQGLLNRLTVAYRERYDHEWLFQGGIVEFKEKAYWVTANNQRFYLNSFKHAKAFLIDYYERAVMNGSIVRDGMPEPKAQEAE